MVWSHIFVPVVVIYVGAAARVGSTRAYQQQPIRTFWWHLTSHATFDNIACSTSAFRPWNGFHISHLHFFPFLPAAWISGRFDSAEAPCFGLEKMFLTLPKTMTNITYGLGICLLANGKQVHIKITNKNAFQNYLQVKNVALNVPSLTNSTAGLYALYCLICKFSWGVFCWVAKNVARSEKKWYRKISCAYIRKKGFANV